MIKPTSDSKKLKKLTASITFENVSISYSNNLAVKNLYLKIPRRKVTALNIIQLALQPNT